MKRRDVLRYTALMTGVAVSAPVVFSLSGCAADSFTKSASYSPTFFSSEEFGLLRSIIDCILPKTDSPSATEVGVDQMIDRFISEVYDEKRQSDFRKKIEPVFSSIQNSTESKAFGKLATSKQIEILQGLANHPEERIKSGFIDLKQQTIAYYLSTEKIGTEFLNYLPTPGPFEGCIELSEVGGKAWAL